MVREWRVFFGETPLLLLPVSGEPPFPDHDDVSSPERFAEIFEAQLPQVAPPFMGLPGLAVTLSLGTDGVPVGAQLLAGRYQEETLLQAAEAIEQGAVTLYESAASDSKTVVFAVTGDMILLPVFEARDRLESEGYKVRIVTVVNPRALYRPGDIAWDTVSQPDNRFMDDDHFNALFDGDVLLGVSGGPSASLEPVLLRTRAPKRDVICWKRGETTASTIPDWLGSRSSL